jgi:hypothetical protein
MQQIVHHPVHPPILARYKAILQTIRVSDLSEEQADIFWEKAYAALKCRSQHQQRRRLEHIESVLFRLSRQAVQ